MKKIVIAILVVALSGLFYGGDAYGGAPHKPDKGWAAGGRYGRLYNPGTVETISGEVVSVQKFIPMRGMSGGLHFILKSDKETISVHLGPTWFLQKEGIKIEPNDHVTVIGSRITFGGNPAIIAAKVTKGGKTWKLRDDTGVPLWSMRRGM